jgi:hypothetical protein
MTAQSSSPFFGSPAALREMLAGHDLAARASRQTAAILTPEEAFDAAQDLWSLCPERLMEPPDAVRVREVDQARAAWRKLKEQFVR